MIAIISPAKTIDFETPSLTNSSSCPEFLDYSQNLINKLRTLSESKLCSLMSISSKLAALNRQRYKDWSLPFTPSNSKQAIMAFKGDVYTGFTFDKYKEKILLMLRGILGFCQVYMACYALWTLSNRIGLKWGLN